MTQAERFRKLMQLHGITYAELGSELNRSPDTVKQRLNSESTFPKHVETYTEALKRCIKTKEKAREKALKEIKR